MRPYASLSPIVRDRFIVDFGELWEMMTWLQDELGELAMEGSADDLGHTATRRCGSRRLSVSGRQEA